MEALEENDSRTSPPGLPQVPDIEKQQPSTQNPQVPSGTYDSLYRTLSVPSTKIATVPRESSQTFGRISLERPSHDFAATKEKPSPNDSESSDSVHKHDSSISWHYLTYDTPLPQPTSGFISGEQDDANLKPPDLNPYTNPLEWSRSKKQHLIWLSCVATTITAYGAGSYAPGVNQMSAYWGTSSVATLVGITLFTAGFGMRRTHPKTLCT